MKQKVAVDVYSWVVDTIDHPSIPIQGIYRHAESLALNFCPVIWLTPEEKASPSYFRLSMALQKIERYLKKEVLVLSRVEQLIAERFQVWLSIAIDSASPVLPMLPQLGIKRIAVLHDTMAYFGLFGERNIETFKFGSQHNDILLPVSKYAEKAYKALPLQYAVKEFVPYGCFHRFDVLPAFRSKMTHSISLGTIHPRKRVVATAQFARKLFASTHYHVGRFEQSEDDEAYHDLVAQKFLRATGFILDEEAEKLMAESFAYLNMSNEEGFSMPPLEAIILGVPFLFLSPIPAHKELYAEVANFLEPEEMPKTLRYSKSVSTKARCHYFEKYRFSEVIRPFELYLK